MKKLTVFILLAISTQILRAQCTIDPNNTEFLSPPPDSLACIERNTPYDEVLQIYIPSTISVPGIPIPVTIDSIVITGISGLPSGINWTMNPSSGVIRGGDRACGVLSGTTNAPAGNYPLTINGTAHALGQSLPLNQPPASDLFQLYVDVIEQGSGCRVATSLRESYLSSSVSIFPNPSRGIFQISGISQGRVSYAIYDFTGKLIIADVVNTKGPYTTQLDLSHLPKGVYAVMINSDAEVVKKSIIIE